MKNKNLFYAKKSWFAGKQGVKSALVNGVNPWAVFCRANGEVGFCGYYRTRYAAKVVARELNRAFS